VFAAVDDARFAALIGYAVDVFIGPGALEQDPNLPILSKAKLECKHAPGTQEWEGFLHDALVNRQAVGAAVERLAGLLREE
jgi:hypothetical protein